MGRNSGSRKIIVYIAVAVIILIAVSVMFVLTFAVKDKEAISQDSGGGTDVSEINIEDSAEYAEKLFKCAVSDVNDSASVVKLLEIMEFESVAGEYTARISEKDGIKVLDLKLSQNINKSDSELFNSNIERCAQQMLALIPQVGKVQWTYDLKTKDGSKEAAVVSLDEEGASSQLGGDVREYGKSAGQFHKLLKKQNEL